MKKIKAILCYIRGYHKYSYFSDECVKCGKKAFKEAREEKEETTY